MNRKINRYFIPIPILLIITIIIIDYRHLTALHKEYDLIERSDSISGIVEDIRSYKGTNFISIDGQKKTIGASSNENYKIPNINDIMDIGDSIVKNANSDTILLYHKNKRYYFIHDDVINRRK